MKISEIEGFEDWAQVVMQQPPLLSFLAVSNGRCANMEEVDAHNAVVHANLAALEQKMQNLCADPDILEFDLDWAKKVIVASIFHETAKETKRAAAYYLSHALKTMEPGEAADAVTTLFEELSEALQDEGKFIAMVQGSGLRVNDFSPYRSRLAKQTAYNLWHVLSFVRFPVSIEGKNGTLNVGELGGFTLQEAIYDKAITEGPQVHERVTAIFRAAERAQPPSFSSHLKNVPEIGTEEHYRQGLGTQEIISRNRKAEIDYLRTHLRHDGFAEFLSDEFDGDFLVVAENDHGGKGTNRFWNSEDTFKACRERGITIFAVEWNFGFQPLIEEFYQEKLSVEDFIDQAVAKELEVIKEIEARDCIERDVNAAFAKAHRPLEIKEKWENNAKTILMAKKHGIRVFAFDGWEGTYIDQEGIFTIQSSESRTANDHNWGDRIGRYCQGEKAIIRIGAAHNPDPQLSRYGTVARLTLCENTRSLIRNRDTSQLAPVALLSGYPSAPVVVASFE